MGASAAGEVAGANSTEVLCFSEVIDFHYFGGGDCVIYNAAWLQPGGSAEPGLMENYEPGSATCTLSPPSFINFLEFR